MVDLRIGYSLSKIFKRLKISLIALYSLIFLVSCTIAPEQVSNIEKAKTIKKSLVELHVEEGEQFVGINLQQAIALALQNNLEYRLQKVQTALAYKQFDLAKTEMYPNLDLTFAYDVRNRDYVKELSDTSTTGAQPQGLIPHTLKTGKVLFNWNVLDLGLSYVRAKQAGDRYLLTMEQRRQQASSIINQVLKNYTLAYYSQELAPQIKELGDSISQALANTDKAIEYSTGDRESYFQYKKTLMEDFRTVKDYLTFFQQAREKFLSLINFNSKRKIENTSLRLVKPDNYLVKLPVVDSNLLYLDTVSLFYRPEISQAVYKVKETQRQRYVVVLEKLPSFGFNFGLNYDSDKFILHQNWWSHNMSIAWNILNLASIPAALDTAETQLEAAKLTHLATSAVILGEIRVLLYNYKMKKYDFHLAEKESEFASSIYNHSFNLNSSGLGDEQTLLKNKVIAVSSELSKLKSFVDARNLFEDFVLALGLYGSKGDFINKGDVNLAAVNEWMNNFNNYDFDKLIDSEYTSINNAHKLYEVSELHSKENKNKNKPKHDQSKTEKHARLKLNMPQQVTDSYQLAIDVKKYLIKLLNYAV